MKQAHRFSGPGGLYEGLTRLGANGSIWTGKVRLVPEKLAEPLRWRKPARVFVNSMSDLFHEEVPDEFIDRVFRVMGEAERHTFQILTKRSERMAAYCSARWGRFGGKTYPPLPNVWLGVSVEDQTRADERIPHLLGTPAAVRFLSCEPLLGPVDLSEYLGVWLGCCHCGEAYGLAEKVHDPEGHSHGADRCARCGSEGNMISLWGREQLDRFLEGSRYDDDRPDDGSPIHWVIVGGESGPGSRTCDLAWVRSIVRQCREAGVSAFVKQLGACASDPPNGLAGARLKVDADAMALVSRRLADPKGGDPDEWPRDICIRESPVPAGGEG